MNSLLDIVKANGSDGVVGLIEEATKAHPEMTVIPSRTIRGIMYKTLVRVALGSTSASFRNANAGSTAVSSRFENRTVETFILEPRFEVDKAVAEAYEDGAQAFIAMEAAGTLEGEMQGLCKQVFYGRTKGGNSVGFPGLLECYDATNMVVDAGGTTATTGSSVWLVRFGPQDVQWVWGLGGSFALSPLRVESIVDSNDSTKKFDGYVQTMLARPGLQVGSVYSACRIKKLTADNGKGLTDSLIAQALGKFPAGKGPNACFMSLRSLAQLQASRTATSPTGAPAPFATSITGIDGTTIPIHVTDAILNTEALTL